MQSTPQSMRPALLAGVERLVAIGMTAEELLAAMTEKAQKAAKKG
jgi:hypothetical protein